MSGGPAPSGRFRDWMDAQGRSDAEGRPVEHQVAGTRGAPPSPPGGSTVQPYPTGQTAAQPYPSGAEPVGGYAPSRPSTSGAYPATQGRPAPQGYPPAREDDGPGYPAGRAHPVERGRPDDGHPDDPSRTVGRTSATDRTPRSAQGYPATEAYPAQGYPAQGSPVTEAYPARGYPRYDAATAGAGAATGGVRPLGRSSVSSGPWPTRVPGRWILASLAAVVVFAVGGVVAVPRFLAGQDVADVFDRTSLATPDQIAGLPRLDGTQITAEQTRSAQQLLSAVTTPVTTQVQVYGQAGSGVRLAVGTARPSQPLSEQEQESLRVGFLSGMSHAQAPVTDLDAGTLGGWFGCGATPGGTTLCLSVDAGALVSITVSQAGGSATDLAQSARRAVVQRAP